MEETSLLVRTQHVEPEISPTNAIAESARAHGLTVEEVPRGNGGRKSRMLIEGKLCSVQYALNARKANGGQRLYATVHVSRAYNAPTFVTLLYVCPPGYEPHLFVVPSDKIALYQPGKRTIVMQVPVEHLPGSSHREQFLPWWDYEDRWDIFRVTP